MEFHLNLVMLSVEYCKVVFLLLGPLLFLIYIIDLPDNVKSTIYMYADDTKVYREIDSHTDVQTLQEDLRIMSEWSNKWLLKFHPQKCTSMAIG